MKKLILVLLVGFIACAAIGDEPRYGFYDGELVMDAPEGPEMYLEHSRQITLTMEVKKLGSRATTTTTTTYTLICVDAPNIYESGVTAVEIMGTKIWREYCKETGINIPQFPEKP